MFEWFAGEQVAGLCEELATLAEARPATAAATARKVALTIRAGLVDQPAAKAALLRALAK